MTISKQSEFQSENSKTSGIFSIDCCMRMGPILLSSFIILIIIIIIIIIIITIIIIIIIIIIFIIIIVVLSQPSLVNVTLPIYILT